MNQATLDFRCSETSEQIDKYRGNVPRIHGVLYEPSRDRNRLLRIEDAALQALIEHGDWMALSAIHARVQQLTGRTCREDSPRRMLGYLSRDTSSEWAVQAKPNPNAPGTKVYRAVRRGVLD